MKTEKYYLILAVVTGILCVPALGEVELPHGPDVTLLARANPTLAGIEELYVVISLGDEADKDALVFKELDVKVKNKLKKTGIKITPGPAAYTFDIPMLSVDIDMLKLKDSLQYVFRIQTSLSRVVILAKKADMAFKADVWKKGSVMQAVPVQDMPTEVTNVVLEQIEAFIHAYLAANPPGGQVSNASDTSSVLLTMQKEPLKPTAKQTVAKYKYVASKNSKVFHIPDCHWAGRIKPDNLVAYNSREEALKAGKRPCKLCKP